MRPQLAILTAALAMSGCSTIDGFPTEKIGGARLSFANGVPAGTAQLLSDGQTVSLALAATGI